MNKNNINFVIKSIYYLFNKIYDFFFSKKIALL